MKPLVSVLLPAYQTEQYIGQTIESVLNQTLTDWELVISDDASTDRTVEIIEGYKDSRIRLIRQPRNLGIVANWAHVVGEGRGEFGYLVGGDDVLEPTHLERKVSLLSQNPESLFVHGPVRLIDSKGAFMALGWTGESLETSSRDFLEQNFNENRVNPTAAVFRLARIKELGFNFDLRYSLLCDWHFWMLLALHSEMVLADTDPTSSYRLHPASAAARSRAGWRWNHERYLVRSDLLLEQASRWRQLGFEVERKHRDLLQVVWPLALQRLRRGRLAEFRETWMLYRRAHSPLHALAELPQYLFAALGRKVTKAGLPEGKGGA